MSLLAGGSTPAVPATNPCWRYRETFNLKEQNKTKRSKDADATWCIAFNFVDLRHKNVFASCGGRRPEEEFFVCKWSINTTTGAPILLLAGATGTIRVVDCHLREVVWTAQGHGDAVNDIAVHPSQPALFVTASRDHSLRLWNLRSQVCVCTMVGDSAHTNEVLSVDFHASDGNKLLSAGMDHSIKIWNLSGLSTQIEASFKYDASTAEHAFHTTTCPCPFFSTHKVHWAYVDCVRWLGDLVLSKSVHNKVFLWEPDMSSKQARHQGYIKCYQEYNMQKAKVWFIRMSLDLHCSVMACGNTLGQVFLWDMHCLSDKPMAVLSRESNTKAQGKSVPNITVRQTAVSHDASIVLACCEDGTIWRWDVGRQQESTDQA
ncbi:hypothetical protein ABBQ32_001772 [Trebouxia sp. C0010 RCD-2024]